MEIIIGVLIFVAVVVFVLLRKNNFGGFKIDAGKDGVKVEVESSNKKTPEPASGPTQIVQVGLNEEDVKKELQNVKKEILESLESGKTENQDEVNILKQELSRVEGKLANTQQALEDRKKVLAETEKALESEQIKNSIPEDQLTEAKEKLEQGDSSQAEELFGQILQEAETKAQAGAEAAFQLAKLAEERIDYQESLRLYEKAVQLAPENSHYLNFTGEMLYTLAQYDKAIEYYEKALASDLKTFGPDHPNVAIRWNNLGSAWNSKGEYDKAIEYYEKALASDLKTFGKDHPNVATSWNNLGAVWKAKGDFDKAIEYYEKALKNFEKAGLQHMIEVVKNNIAELDK